MGIEPTSEAWEASILPLYDARSAIKLAKHFRARKHRTASNVDREQRYLGMFGESSNERNSRKRWQLTR